MGAYVGRRRLHQWLVTQRIGFCAYRLNLPTFGRLSYRRTIEDELCGFSAAQASLKLNSLPASTLALLLDVHARRLGHDLEAERPRWNTARTRLTERIGTDRSVLSGAELVAYHLLYGSHRATTLLRAASSFLMNAWRAREQEAALKSAIRETIRTLRLPFNLGVATSTASKLDALDRLANEIRRPTQLSDPQETAKDPRRPWTARWTQVENTLYQHIFQWPLFASDAPAYGFSLPVSVEVAFDDAGESNEPHIVGLGNIDIGDWRSSLTTSIKAAKDLWLSQHANRRLFAREVAKASVTIDFSFAEEVVTPASAAGEPVRLEGRSMEAYFSQVVLSQLLGALTPLNAATGVLRTPIIGDQSRNYEVEWPDGVEEKLQYAFKTRLFNRVVVPSLDAARGFAFQRATDGPSQTASVKFARRLSNFADAFQTSNWRRFTFVRAPDLLECQLRCEAEGTTRSAEPSERVLRCLRMLAAAPGPVVEAGDGVTPEDLIETALSLRDREFLGLSWTFVRTVADERDERFWHTIWSAAGAPREAFDALQWSHSSADTAVRLAEVLNQLSPTTSTPSHRAPHVLVIVGAERITRHLGTDVSTANAGVVLNLLGRALQPVDDDRARAQIGRSRVILVGDRAPAAAVAPLQDHQLNQVLVRLSLFRFGFQQQMAAAVLQSLGICGTAVRDVLTRLVQEKALVRVGGGYYVPRALGIGDASGTPAERAAMHYNTALAYAPHLAQNDNAAADLDRAFDPESVHEAQDHLQKALQLLRYDAASRTLYAQARKGLLYLARWYDSGGRCSLKALMQLNVSRDANEIADELLATDALRDSPPVLRFAAAAKLKRADELMTTAESNPRARAAASVLRATARDLLERTLVVLRSRRLTSPDYLASLTELGSYLLRHGDRQDMARLSSVNEEALSLIDASRPEGVSPYWCDQLGDVETDHALAARLYQLGDPVAKQAFYQVTKLVGALDLAGDEPITEAMVQRFKAVIAPAEFERWLSASPRRRGMHFVHVQNRLDRGLKRLSAAVQQRRSTKPSPNRPDV